MAAGKYDVLKIVLALLLILAIYLILVKRVSDFLSLSLSIANGLEKDALYDTPRSR